MDIDPLGDHVPPRHAIESDDEEDEFNPLSKPPPTPEIFISTAGHLGPFKALIVATGPVAAFWARGADLGEQVAAVSVNKKQIGLGFKPKWTDALVLMSEATNTLPAWAMHPYARAVLDAVKPSIVTLLDSYPAPAYITPAPIPYYESPGRVLSLESPSIKTNPAIQPYSPPNILSTTSAAFLSLLALPTSTPPPACSALLVPASHIPPPPPRDVAPARDTPESDWPVHSLEVAHAALANGGIWNAAKATGGRKVASERWRGDVGDGGMYI